ncbi:hypothetical protein Pmani_008900 [Petrolisthes manimaculis]|uniref:Uncharacterized protein n=1 Tax=Petrolisthes manimaculis TaxID=1843537 RepID=A0AAE1UJ18_9EUCA|nr:hypothetical protein Pmani_008900 [Petrolisthes manimaculis]
MIVSDGADGTDTNVGNSDIKESDDVDGEVEEDSWSGSEVRDSSSSGDHSNYQDPLQDGRLGTWGVGLDYDLDRGVSRMAPSPRRTVEVTRDSGRTNAEVMVRCLSTPTILFPNIPTSSPLNHSPPNPMAYNPPYDDDDGGDKVDEDGSDILGEDEVKSELLVKDATGSGRGIEVDLTQLVDAAVGGQLVVDVEGCGPVGVGVGIPGWAEGVTFAIKGTLWLRREWWSGGVGLKEMWLRVNGGLTRAEGEETDGAVGVGDGDLCHNLPPTLEVLDITHTPTRELLLEESCAPHSLERLEAKGCELSSLSLHSPSLQHLRKLDVRNNILPSLDLSSTLNLTSLLAAHNLLSTPPTLPHTLTYLDLGHNMLTEIPVLTPVLVTADLSHNTVKTVGEARFKAAKKLEYLSLAHNHITQIHERDLEGLRHLRTLDLSHNRLRTIWTSAFHPLRHLRHLHLDHNHLRKLDVHTLAKLPSKTHATLHHNPWECSCQLLAKLSKLSKCTNCGHKSVNLECREGGSLVSAGDVLRKCFHAAQGATQLIVDESDEDLSEEEEVDPVDEGGKSGSGAVMVVPGLVVLLVVGIFVVLSYRVYSRHRRSISTRLAPFCGFCGDYAPASINNNHHNDPRRMEQLSQIDNDSETETEM